MFWDGNPYLVQKVELSAEKLRSGWGHPLDKGASWGGHNGVGRWSTQQQVQVHNLIYNPDFNARLNPPQKKTQPS